MSSSFLSAFLASALSGMSVPPTLTPVAPGAVVVETRIACESIKRLPCVSGKIIRSGIIYTSGTETFIATVPSLSDEESRQSDGSSFSLTLADRTAKAVAIRLVASDFGANLDLFEITDRDVSTSLSRATSLRTRSDFDPEAAPLLTAVGPQLQENVKLISTSSDRTFIPLLPSALEVLTRSELPLSQWAGAAFYTSNERELVGLIGDEFLKLQPGKSTRLIRYTDLPEAKVNHAVMIPESFIRTHATRLASGQLPYIRRVNAACHLAEGVRSCEVCDTRPEEEAPSSASFPIGGANGSGVGGLLSNGRRCKLQFTGAQSNTAALPPAGKSWFKSLKAHSSNGKIEAWYSRDSQGAVWILGSASEFFRVVNDSTHVVPKIHVQSPHPTGSALGQLHASAERVALLAFQGLPMNSTEVSRFRAQLYTLARLLQSDRRDFVPLQVLEQIRDSHEVEWYFIEGALRDEFIRLCELRKSAP